MLAGLPYVVWPIGSFFILASRKKEEPFLCYHAIQALLSGAIMCLLVLGVTVLLFLGFRVLPGSASYAPAVISLGTLGVGAVTLVSLFLSALFLGWRATEGEMLRLPFLGDFAEQKMLDQTGMTRRQFEQIRDEADQQVEVEEEIPFPEVQPESYSRTPQPERAIDRLEAARQARAAAQQQQQRESETTRPVARPEPRPQQPPARPSPAAQRRPQMPPQQPTRPAQPVVKEVDLISHYKDKQVGRGNPDGQSNDVLRQWLSSVDNES